MFRRLMRTLPPVLLVAVLASCGGTDPSASGVFPAAGFLGRQMRVQISGDATEWNASTKVNFGEGVTVDSITVSSPTALFANITISDTAPVGLRDVVVTGGDNVTLEEAFEIESPITISFRGNAAQGSIGVLDIVNHDFDTPFDTTSTGDGFFSPLVYTGMTAQAGNGVRISFDNVTPYGASATVLMDIDAVSGALSIISGPAGKTTAFPLGADLAIAPRTAIALTTGMNVSAMAAKPYDSFLYEFTAGTGPSLAQFRVSSTSTDANPRLAVMPASGHFDDLLGASSSFSQLATTGERFYIVLFDFTGELATYQTRASSAVVTMVSETEPGNNAAPGATACPLPCLVKGAELSSKTDEDWFKFTSGPNDAGKRLHVTTLPGDAQTDTVVDAFEVQGASSTSLGGPSDDNGYHEDFQFSDTAIKNATSYTVQIFASDVFKDTQKRYDALIFLE